MGAYLYFKVGKKQADKFNEIAFSVEENKRLQSIDRGIGVYYSGDIEWAEKERPDLLSHVHHQQGRGEWKASGICDPEGDLSYDEIFQNVVATFKVLHEKIQFKVYSGSCALKLDYFDKEQLRIITNNGKNLSSTPSDDRERILRDMEIDPISLES